MKKMIFFFFTLIVSGFVFSSCQETEPIPEPDFLEEKGEPTNGHDLEDAYG